LNRRLDGLFRNRLRPAQIVLGGVVPAVAGAIAGMLLSALGGRIARQGRERSA